MIKFPIKFEVQANAPSGANTQWTVQTDELPPIPSAIPPEFMGPGGGYSPEELFAAALLNCLIATFKIYCDKSKVAFQEIKGKIILTMDKVQPGGLAITNADIFFDITGSSDAEKTRKLLDGSIRDCVISNSVKTGKTFHINIS